MQRVQFLWPLPKIQWCWLKISPFEIEWRGLKDKRKLYEREDVLLFSLDFTIMSDGRLEKMDKDFSPQVDALLPETETLAKVKQSFSWKTLIFTVSFSKAK